MSDIRTLFATQVYQSSIAEEKGFEAFLAELDEACCFIAEEDKAGHGWCKANAYPGYTSYASLDDLPQRATVFETLKSKLDKRVAAFAKTLAFDLGGKKLKLDSLWINVLKPGGTHTSHIHPHSVISGTLYVRTPPGAGALKLEDPRLAMMMAAPTRTPDAPEILQPFVYLKPAPGTIFMWESWLRHEVMANQGREARMSVSFNYRWGG